MTSWEKNALWLAESEGVYVDWEEEYYICPECEEPICADDWDESDFEKWLCPVCGFAYQEEE